MAATKGTNEKLGGGGFHHVAVRVPDFDAGVRFYRDVLGFEKKVEWGEAEKRVALLDTGDGNYVELLGGGSAGATLAGPFLHVAIRTTDVDGAVARARAAGMEVTVEPKDVTIQGRPFAVPVRLAFFKGPGGEVIELFQNDLT
jgi:catechol 2,3-dioxygenase-like lactoylglutathione lyase family enzyme